MPALNEKHKTFKLSFVETRQTVSITVSIQLGLFTEQIFVDVPDSVVSSMDIGYNIHLSPVGPREG